MINYLYFKENWECYSCGKNHYGQLGLGDNLHRIIPEKIKFFKNKHILGISCGHKHLIFWTNEEIYVCSHNRYGQLGLGDNNHRNIPEKINFFENKTILGIFCGSLHSIFWTNEGIYMCGDNTYGQLGIDDIKSVFSLTKIPNTENFICPINSFDFTKRKLLCLIREYCEDSLLYKYNLPMDMFKLILKESRLYYDKVQYLESIYYENKK